MTDDLPDWLRAQLNEDERIARATAWSASTQTDNPWNAQPPRNEDEGWTVWAKTGRFLMFRGLEEVDARHIAEHDPARVLREIDAKRELLRQYENLKYAVMPDDMSGVFALEAVIRAHAEVYDARSGYRPEWRP